MTSEETVFDYRCGVCSCEVFTLLYVTDDLTDDTQIVLHLRCFDCGTEVVTYDTKPVLFDS